MPDSPSPDRATAELAWIVEVTRTVPVALPDATTHAEAKEMGLAIGRLWQPPQAHAGDRGTASVRVLQAGDLATGEGIRCG